MELYVFDINFNRLGVIDNYEEVEIERKYYKHSTLSLTVEASKKYVELLLTDEPRILVKSTDLQRGYIIETPQFEDEKKAEITVLAYSLSYMTNWRIIQGQQRFKGNIEDVIKGFVNANCINPSDLKRKIPNLVLGANTGINIITDEMYNNKPLDESLWEICEKFEVSYEILMNHDKKQFEFIVYQGADRSAEQNVNPHIIFAKAFDNVIKQSFVDDKSNYRSTAYVAGEGEGAERTVLKVNDNFSGLDRRELFIDARDLQSNFKDENGNEVSIPENEYLAILQERGLNKLSEYQRIRTFESDVENSQFIFEEDYFLGDKVTTRNDELNIITHARIVVAKEKHNRKGYELKIEFGVSIPTFIDKVKREIKNQSSSGGSSSSVVSEIEWNNVKDKPSTYPPSSHDHDDRYYTEVEINNLLNDKAKFIDLSNQVQNGANRRSVVAICELTNTNINLNSWSVGLFSFHRHNGLQGHVTALIGAEKKYNTSTMHYTCLAMGFNAQNIRPCTFIYKGVKYGGFEYYFNDANHNHLQWFGHGNFEPFGLDYYDTRGTVLNNEVYNSIEFDSPLTLDNIHFNGRTINSIYQGNGSPEGVVSAPVGSIYININGGSNTTLYVKTSGTGNTGWTAK